MYKNRMVDLNFIAQTSSDCWTDYIQNCPNQPDERKKKFSNIFSYDYSVIPCRSSQFVNPKIVRLLIQMHTNYKFTCVCYKRDCLMYNL